MWMASCPSGVSTTALSVVSSPNLLRVHSNPPVNEAGEATEQYWSQYGALKDTTFHQCALER